MAPKERVEMQQPKKRQRPPLRMSARAAERMRSAVVLPSRGCHRPRSARRAPAVAVLADEDRARARQLQRGGHDPERARTHREQRLRARTSQAWQVESFSHSTSLSAIDANPLPPAQSQYNHFRKCALPGEGTEPSTKAGGSHSKAVADRLNRMPSREQRARAETGRTLQVISAQREAASRATLHPISERCPTVPGGCERRWQSE
eukprot:6210168-Pleurochrysis_carterae.AAC.1